MNLTLFILAAGMGSRYGGLKQLDGVGPSGETIMDYSIFDAIRAGFTKVVFVIRRDFESAFREQILPKYQNHISVELVYQSLDSLPEGFTPPAERVKPWGTNHAVLMGAEAINEPFAVINADDFYGRDSFQVLASYLREVASTKGNYSMVGFRVGNTLSESGTVSRGVCSTNSEGFLTGVVERTSIERVDGVIVFTDEQGEATPLEENTPVSMNMWGFTPDYFAHSERIFREFLAENRENLKAEFYIPTAVNELILAQQANVKVLDTTSKWFGVTYAEDRDSVVAKLEELVTVGDYPKSLF